MENYDNLAQELINKDQNQMKNSMRQNDIFQAVFTYRKVAQIEKFLNSNPNINFMSISDAQGNNLLHQLAYQGQLDLIKIYVHEVKKYILKKKDEDITTANHYQRDFDEWINKKNNQGFAPLLYAAYSGNLDVIKYLVEQHHADTRVKTNSGLNALHLASQKNMIMPFLYLRERIGLGEVDDMKSTPLHWAAYMNSQEVVSYILSNSDLDFLDLKDSEGNTPLMLAVTYGNTRIVRRLLVKGANRYIRNSDGKLAIDVAQQSQFKTITKMLNENFSMCDFVKLYCNIKIEYKPKNRKFIIPTLFLAALAINVTIIFMFLQFKDQMYLIITASLYSLLFIFYLSLLVPKPRGEHREYRQLLNQFTEKQIKKACFQCRNIVPKRGYHCDICGVCIKQYDHHCTWINNCVGKKNLSRFIFFLTFLLLSLASIAALSVMGSIAVLSQDLLTFQQFFIFRYEYMNDLEKYCLLGLFLFCEITSVFFFPILTLFIVQVKNLLTNKTTFEKVRGTAVEQNATKRRMRQKKVSLRNCRVMCTDFQGSFITARSSFGQILSGDKSTNDQLTTEKYGSEAVEGNPSLR